MQELEKIIRDWYLSHGYEASWLQNWFKINIVLLYKEKKLRIMDLVGFDGVQDILIYETTKPTLDEAIEDAVAFFKKV